MWPIQSLLTPGLFKNKNRFSRESTPLALNINATTARLMPLHVSGTLRKSDVEPGKSLNFHPLSTNGTISTLSVRTIETCAAVT